MDTNVMNEVSVSPHALGILVCAIGVFVLRVFRTRRKSSREAETLPFPPRSRAGMIETIRAMVGPDCPWFYLRSANENGPVFRLPLPLPGCPMVVLSGDAALNREIYTDPQTTKPPELYSPFDPLTAGCPSIITAEGHRSNHARRGVARAFAPDQIRRISRCTAECADRWVAERLEPLVRSGRSFDVGKEMLKITMGILCEAAFEYSMDEAEADVFHRELNIALKEYTLKQALIPFRRLFGPLLPETRRAVLACERLQGIARRILDSYRALSSPTENTVIDRIARNPGYEDDRDRAADILIFLIAGHDTTSYSLAWALIELARNPEEQARLRRDLRSTPREGWARSDALRRAVRESMRLRPVAAAGSTRKLGRDFVVRRRAGGVMDGVPRGDGGDDEGDILIPKGSVVFATQIIQYYDESVYPDAESFVPSRWENPSKEAVAAFTPFVLGRRNCVGQAMADTELHYVCARLCAEFEFSVEDEGEVDFFLTLKPAGTRLKAKRVATVADVSG